MADCFLRQVAATTADQLLRDHLAWLPREQRDALRPALAAAVLAGLATAAARYEHAHRAPPPAAP